MMKFNILFIFMFLFGIQNSIYSQINHTLTIYSEIEDAFILTVNGEKMNESYQKKVSFDTEHEYVNVIIEFENQAVEKIEHKFLQIGPVGETDKGKPVATVYKIYKKEAKKKGEVVSFNKLGFVSRSLKKIQTQTVIIQEGETKSSDGVTIKKGNSEIRIGN